MSAWATPMLDIRPEQREHGQLPLFGTDLEVPTHTDPVSPALAAEGPGARARAGDPITSHRAASSITTQGMHASQVWVLTELRTLGLATMPQLVRRVPDSPTTGQPMWSDSRIRSAVKELTVLKLVEHVDDQGITSRGRACARYQAVSR